MKIFKLTLFVIFVLALLSSCGTVNNLNGKLIVGSWKNVKVLGSTATSSDVSEAIEIKKMIQGSSGSNDPSVFQARFPEMIMAIQFKGDNTVQIISGKTTVKGNWKINKPGTIISVTGPDKKVITRIDLKRVDATSMEITDPFAAGSNGNLILLFKKQ